MKPVRAIASLLSACFCIWSCGATAGRTTQDPSKPPAEQASKPEPDKPVKKGPKAPVDPSKFAMIVAGVGGEEEYTRKFTDQAMRLYEALTSKFGFGEENVRLLIEHPSAGGPENDARETESVKSVQSTAEEVRKAFAGIKAAAKPESTVLIVLIGHGQVDNQQAKFNLVGPDLSAKDYAQLVAGLPARRVIFVNCASASGDFIKALSGQNRIIITATRSVNEQNATVFAEHFVAALNDPAADTDKNGRISVLEAFNYASRQTAEWYKQRNRLATEHSLIDDNGDGVGHEDANGGDGALARVTYLDSTTIEQAGSDAELARLLAERQRLEESIEKHKLRKADMKQEDYDTELERLLVELAKLNQSIKARQKKPE